MGLSGSNRELRSTKISCGSKKEEDDEEKKKGNKKTKYYYYYPYNPSRE